MALETLTPKWRAMAARLAGNLSKDGCDVCSAHEGGPWMDHDKDCVVMQYFVALTPSNIDPDYLEEMAAAGYLDFLED